jgi:hypothetical protein
VARASILGLRSCSLATIRKRDWHLWSRPKPRDVPDAQLPADVGVEICSGTSKQAFQASPGQNAPKRSRAHSHDNRALRVFAELPDTGVDEMRERAQRVHINATADGDSAAAAGDGGGAGKSAPRR